MRRRNFPKGYAEMLEKQHNQLVCGLQEMCRRLQKASLWEGEPLDESNSCPLTHDILAALNFLEPQADDSGAEFIEQPRSSPLLEAPDDDDDDQTPAESTIQEVSHPTSHNHAFFFDSDAPAQTSTSRSPNKALSPTTPSPHQVLAQPKSQQPTNNPTPPRHILPVLSPPPFIQPDLLWDDPLYTYHASQEATSSTSSSFDSSTNWYLSPPTMLPSLATQVPAGGLGFYNVDLSCQKKALFAPRPSLCHKWLGNGISLDSSDFIGDFHQLSPEVRTSVPVGLERPRRLGSLP